MTWYTTGKNGKQEVVSDETAFGVGIVLESIGVDLTDPNFQETPQRVAKWLREKFPSQEEYDKQIAELAKKVFPSKYDEMIVQTGIRVCGLCPHHLKDVIYNVSVGYLPNGQTIGLSKLARAAVLCMGRAGTQEDLTNALANTLQKMLGVEDVAVVAIAQHNCMECRGVKMRGAKTMTSDMRGHFKRDEGGSKAEFFNLIRLGREE